MGELSIPYLAPLVLVICANSFYHLISKSIPETLNPFLGLTVTYGVALIFSAVLFLCTKSDSVSLEVSRIKWSSFLLGIAVWGVESGWIWMYRNGWEISRASVLANICVAMILLVVGLTVFREEITVKRMAGFAICVLGVYLLNSK